MSDALLIHAVANGDIEQARALVLEGSANVNAPTSTSATPLHVAVQRGYAALVEFLLSCGSDVSQFERIECGGQTPLHAACRLGHTRIVEMLLNAGASVHTPDSLGYTPLHWAARNGHMEIVKLLIAKGCDVEAKDLQGKPAYYWAKEFRHHDIAALLPVWKYDVWGRIEARDEKYGVKKDDEGDGKGKKKDAKKKKK
jgi:ankyrin repeat protein